MSETSNDKQSEQALISKQQLLIKSRLSQQTLIAKQQLAVKSELAQKRGRE
jgi:hypothetical protein